MGGHGDVPHALARLRGLHLLLADVPRAPDVHLSHREIEVLHAQLLELAGPEVQVAADRDRLAPGERHLRAGQDGADLRRA